jgi:hypothetical protein
VNDNRILSKFADVGEDFAEVLSHWSEIVKRFLTGRWAKVALVVVAFFALLRVLSQSTFGRSLRVFGVVLGLVMLWNVYAFVRINSDDCHKTGSIYGAATFVCKKQVVTDETASLSRDAQVNVLKSKLNSLHREAGFDLGGFCEALEELTGEYHAGDCGDWKSANEWTARWFVDRLEEAK